MKVLGISKVSVKELALGMTLLVTSGCAPELKQYFSSIPELNGSLPNLTPSQSDPGQSSSTPEPSSSPSSSPSNTPSGSPSGTPTGTPTGTPSGSPTPTPSVSPSESPSPGPSETPPPDKTVCDPFGTPSTVPTDSVGHGLVAKLKYLEDNQPRYTSLADYANHAKPVDASFYFFQMNVPTRYFTQGFQNQNGTSLMKPDGTVLFEYFYLHFDSQLRLPAGTGTKKFQFGLIADDGSILKVNQGSGYTTWINNDGTHPTRFACASQPLTLSDQAGIPITVDYYQGPRYNIALMLMVRDWTDDTQGGSSFNPADPLCGAESNELFFNYQTVPSTPNANYQALLSRGWKVVPPEYFYLPGNPPPPNPCQ